MKIRTGQVFLLLLTFFAMSLLMAGCGNVAEKASEKAAEKAIEQASGGKAKVDLDNKGNVEITTEEGSLKTGSTEWPSAIPSDVPRLKDGEIVSVIESNPNEEGKGFFVAMENVSMEAVENYKSELTENGWNIVMTINTPDSVGFSAQKNNGLVTVNFTVSEGELVAGGVTYSEEN